jgi:hypothetical protein
MLDRFKLVLSEPSTWRGFIWLLTALGLKMDPSQAEAIVSLGLALSGAIAVFFTDTHPSTIPTETPPTPTTSVKDVESEVADTSVVDLVKKSRKRKV